MRLTTEQLAPALARGLKPIYLVSGDEPLLVGEAVDAIRAAARAAGYQDRMVFFVDRGFNWETLRQESQSLSLFANLRVFELRMPTGKPDKGAALLLDLATRPPPDTVILVITDKLDNKVADSAWVRAIDTAGAWVRVLPVGKAALPSWLKARARALQVELEPEAAELIVERVEGNLLAAQQELEKLALLAGGDGGEGGGRITAALVLQSVGQSARYDVFELGTAAAGGDGERTLRVLLGLKSEGVEPTLILWALNRELRGMWQLRERTRLRNNARGSGWHLAAPPSPEAVARLAKMPLARLLRQAHRVDRVLKGLAGGDPWTALTGLAAAMAGALQATPDSGRVSSV